MRLTLRTMLAFLDDILEPADARELAKKIEDSEFARGLVHRIRGIIGRMRLAAPNVSGTGIANDANFVAEYLDNTLEAERVPEFERICLESDLHLAEVASCHQVLTLVLGEPAHVDPSVRDRIYQLSDQQTSDHEAETGRATPDHQPTDAPTTDGSDQSIRREDDQRRAVDETEVEHAKSTPPDYLVAGRRGKFWSYAATAIASFALAVIVLLLAGDKTDQLVAILMDRFNAEVSFQQPEIAVPQTSRNSIDTHSGSDEIDMPVDSVDPNASANSASHLATDTEIETFAQSAETDTTVGSYDFTETDAGPPARESTAIGNRAHSNGQGAILPETSKTSNPPQPAELPILTPTVPEPNDPATNDPATNDPATNDPATNDQVSISDDDHDQAPVLDGGEVETASNEEAIEVVNVGTFSSDDEILLRQGPGNEQWLRVPAGDTIFSTDQLLVLPMMRSTINVNDFGRVSTEGAALFGVGYDDAIGTPLLSLGVGTFQFAALAGETREISIRTDTRRGRLVMDERSEVTVHVERIREPGTDPEVSEPNIVMRIRAVAGAAHWHDFNGSEREQPIEDNGILVLVDDQPVQWVSSRNEDSTATKARPRAIDRNASAFVIEYLLEDERPVTAALQDESAFRHRPEVRSLARRCLAHLGYYDPLLELVNDEDQRAFWDLNVRTLQRILSSDRDSASGIWLALRQHRGQDAPLLYRMLWGYSDKDIDQGVGDHLVDMLDHSSLDVRVLAITNLRQLSGIPSLYQPQHSPQRRRQAIRQWRIRVNDGELISKSKPFAFDSLR